MARTIGRALLYRHPYLVGRDGLVRGKHREVRIMNRHQTLCKISHYEWMLESMTLKPAHELWIRDQIEDLLATLPILREREGIK